MELHRRQSSVQRSWRTRASTRRRRLLLESLESRQLLTTGDPSGGVAVAPALIVVEPDPHLSDGLYVEGAFATGEVEVGVYPTLTARPTDFHFEFVTETLTVFHVGEDPPELVTPSMLDPANYRLLAGDVDISSTIVEIARTPSASRRGVDVTLTLDHALAAGEYTLIASGSIRDRDDELLCGRPRKPGTDYERTFRVMEVFGRTGDVTIDPLYDYPSEFIDVPREGGGGTIPQIASLANGNTIATWSYRQSYRPNDAPQFTIHRVLAQRYDATGSPLGDLIVVSQEPNSTIQSVAADDAGNFVVVWTTEDGDGPTGTLHNSQVRARCYDAEGNPQGNVLLIDPSAGPSAQATVAMDRAGNFVIVWSSTSASGRTRVLAESFWVGGIPQSRFLVGHGTDPYVAARYGSLAVTWLRADDDTDHATVMARRFDWLGNALGSTLEVADVEQRYSRSDIALDDSGNVVVLWSDPYDLYFRRFDASGTPLAEAQRVNSGIVGSQWDIQASPRLAMDAVGNFFVAWTDSSHTPPGWIHSAPDYYFAKLRAYTADGTPIGEEVRPNASRRDFIDGSSLSVSSAGHAVVSWYDGNFTQFRKLVTQQPPLVDLNGPGLGTSFTATVIPGSQPVSIVNSQQLLVASAASENLTSATITIIGALAGDVLSAKIQGTAITSSYSNGVLALWGNDTLANYQKVLRSVTFTATADRPAWGTIDVTFVVTDESAQSTTAHSTVDIVDIHDPNFTRIVARQLFYNDSAFDGNDSAANSLDDAAIAPATVALLPGQTAGSVNFTNSIDGITGLMIDVAGPHGTLSAEDFELSVGNVQAQGAWRAAPAPSAVLVRPGAGENGSDRVEIVWPTGAILNQWIRVTVKANANTRLTTPDTFSFGNLAGDTTADGRFSPRDALSLINHLLRHDITAAAIDDLYDVNHDGVVSPKDLHFVVDRLLLETSAQTFITAPPPPVDGDVSTAVATGSYAGALAFALSTEKPPSPTPNSFASARTTPPPRNVTAPRLDAKALGVALTQWSTDDDPDPLADDSDGDVEIAPITLSHTALDSAPWQP